MSHANPTDDPRRTNYGHLNRVTDEATRNALKLIMDRLGHVEGASEAIGTLTTALSSDLDAGGNKLTAVADGVNDLDAVNMRTMMQYVEAAIASNAAANDANNPSGQQPTPTPTGGTARPPGNRGPNPTPTPVPIPTPPGICYTSIAGGQPGGIPGKDIRWFRGDFCGIEVPGMPFVADGRSEDTGLILSPYLDRYSPANQTTIINAHLARGYTHFLFWWPNSRDAAGQSIDQFVATCQKVATASFFPVVTLYSKVYDGQNPDPTKTDALIAALAATGMRWVCCVGFEMDEFMDPGDPIQAVIDHVTSQTVPLNVNTYVHFSEGLVSWQATGGGGDWWRLQQGKLCGLMHQKNLGWDCPNYQAKLNDLQERFGNGVSGWPTDSGFGHPFDLVAAEYSAALRFSGAITETQAIALGQQAIATPGPSGSLPPIGVKGFLNGGPGLRHGT